MRSSRKPRKLPAHELFEYAVKCLGVRPYSTGDLRLKLQLRAAHLPDVDSAILRLKEVGYLDDRRFAESFASARVENEGFGRMRVLTDLRIRRIGGDLAEEAVKKALDGKDEAELIDAYIERRMPSLASGGLVEDPRKFAAAYRRLRRAGFTSAPVMEALKRRAAHPELLEEISDPEDSEDVQN